MCVVIQVLDMWVLVLIDETQLKKENDCNDEHQGHLGAVQVLVSISNVGGKKGHKWAEVGTTNYVKASVRDQ